MTDIPDSVMDAFLAAMGWRVDEPRNRAMAEAPIRAVIDAWEAWEALPIVSVYLDDDQTTWWWGCDSHSKACLADNLGMGRGYLTKESARAVGAKHLADIHDGEGRLW